MDARQTAYLAKLYAIAKDHGGECLSTEYKNNCTGLLFRCANKHEWLGRGDHISRGVWCAECAQSTITLQTCQDLAAARGGLCLSDNYINNKITLKWRCSYKHEWEARFKDIKDGQWCPSCSKFFSVGEELVRTACEECFPGKQFISTRSVSWMQGLELDVFNDTVLPKPLALERQGIQHYEEDKFFHREEGKFEAQQARDALKRQYCLENNCNLIEVPYTVKDKDIRDYVRQEIMKLGYTIADKVGTDAQFYDQVRAAGPKNEVQFARALELIAAKKGICLSLQYLGTMAPLFVECEKGHKFETTLNRLDHGYFCQKCAGNGKQSDEEIKKQVEHCGYRFHGLKTVKTANSSRRHVEVECAQNHRYWVALTVFSTKNGDKPKYGCKQCYLGV